MPEGYTKNNFEEAVGMLEPEIGFNSIDREKGGAGVGNGTESGSIASAGEGSSTLDEDALNELMPSEQDINKFFSENHDDDTDGV